MTATATAIGGAVWLWLCGCGVVTVAVGCLNLINQTHCAITYESGSGS
eukprot:COSAG06_NODE_65313_length_257_cov_0.658228_1_plen_47_part_10